MNIIRTVREMREMSDAFRQAQEVIGFVPTMGFLHEGHLVLMREARRICDRLVVSIFVNPTQFGKNEDFGRYPKDTEGDLTKCSQEAVDILFLPSVEEIYPEGFQTRVQVLDLPRHLCGLSRPGHFDGVATVVAKLFNITKPHCAVFGQKDYQQLAVISRMVSDLNLDVTIVGVPTVREPDGLAMSSRNSYLSLGERQEALCLKRALDLAGELVAGGEGDPLTVQRAMEALVSEMPSARIDYIRVCDPVTLDPVTRIEGEVLVALAVHIGKTRLIDNAVLSGVRRDPRSTRPTDERRTS